MTRIAVVIPSLGRPQLLEVCLPSILKGFDRPEELYVVFQGEADGELEAAVNNRCPLATVLWAPLRGASAARNCGVAQSQSDVIVFIDDDCRADPGWLAAYRQFFDQRPDIGIAGGRVLADDSLRAEGVLLAIQDDTRGYEIEGRTNPVGKLDRGGNLAVRRQTFADLRGFDQSLGTGTRFPGAEDTEFIYRAMSSGIRMAYLPDAVAVHGQWRAARDAARAEHGYAIGLGAFIAQRMRSRDWYGASLGPRLLWHLGAKPVLLGLVQRRLGRTCSGLRYVSGIPKGILRGWSRKPDLGNILGETTPVPPADQVRRIRV